MVKIEITIDENNEESKKLENVLFNSTVTIKAQEEVIKKLTDALIEEKCSHIKSSIPDGNCPCAYYPGLKFNSGCNDEEDVSCGCCKERFNVAVREYVEKEIRNFVSQNMAETKQRIVKKSRYEEKIFKK